MTDQASGCCPHGVPGWRAVALVGLAGLGMLAAPLKAETNNLALFYAFDDTNNLYLDSSGHGRNGWGVDMVASPSGKVGGCVYNRNVFASPASGESILALNASSNLTLMAWIRKTTRVTGDEPLIQKSSAYYVGLTPSGLAYRVEDPSTGGIADISCACENLDDGVWHHVAVAVAGTTSNVSFYVDGQLVKSTTAAGRVIGPPSSQPVFMGRNSGSFLGWFDQVRIYLDALTPDEVAAICSAEGGAHDNYAYPAWWKRRGMVNLEVTNGTDMAMLRTGQLKWFATNACAELDDQFAAQGGAGPNIHSLVAGFSLTNNRTFVTRGQLKHAASLFHERINSLAATNTMAYPWTADSLDDHDFTPATVGQMKYLFSFDSAHGWALAGLPAEDVVSNNAWASALLFSVQGAGTGVVGRAVLPLGVWNPDTDRFYLSRYAGRPDGWGEGTPWSIRVKSDGGVCVLETALSASDSMDITEVVKALPAGSPLVIELLGSQTNILTPPGRIWLLKWSPAMSAPDNLNFAGEPWQRYVELPLGCTKLLPVNRNSPAPSRQAFPTTYRFSCQNPGGSGALAIDPASVTFSGAYGGTETATVAVTGTGIGPVTLLASTALPLTPSNTLMAIPFLVSKVDMTVDGVYDQVGTGIPESIEGCPLLMTDAAPVNWPWERRYRSVVVGLASENYSLAMKGLLTVEVNGTLVTNVLAGMGSYSADFPSTSHAAVTATWHPEGIVNAFVVSNVFQASGAGQVSYSGTRHMVIGADGAVDAGRDTNEFPGITFGVPVALGDPHYSATNYDKSVMVAVQCDGAQHVGVTPDAFAYGTNFLVSNSVPVAYTLAYLNGAPVSIPLSAVTLTATHEAGDYSLDVHHCESSVVLDSYVDVDVDSGNTHGFGVPEPCDPSGASEMQPPGKIILANRGDVDNNGIPDYAQFNSITGGTHFTPLSIKLPAPGTGLKLSDVQLRFNYSLSSPQGVTSSNGCWQPAPGVMRIWKKDSNVVRDPSCDLVTNGTYLAADLGNWDADSRLVLYIEGISGGADMIDVVMGPVGQARMPYEDSVLVTVAQIDYAIDHACTNAIHASHVVRPSVSPAGILGAASVTYTMVCLPGSGSGAACFTGSAANTTNLAGGTGTLEVRGLEPSSVISNMALKAVVGGNECMSARFTIYDVASLSAAQYLPGDGLPALDPPAVGQTNVLNIGEWSDGENGSMIWLVQDALICPAAGFSWDIVPTGGVPVDPEWVDWVWRNEPGPGPGYAAINGAGVANREFQLRSWFDCDGDGLYADTESHRLIELKVVEVADLVLSNAASGTTVISTNRDGAANASNTLFLVEGTNGTATMTIRPDWLPANVPPEKFRWEIVSATNDDLASGAEWLLDGASCPAGVACGSVPATVTWTNTGAGVARQFKVRAWFDADGDGQLSWFDNYFGYKRIAYVNILKVDLKEVSFSGTDNHTLQSDDQLTTFSAPHYLDANLDGDANDAGDRCYPVCYTRNKKMKAGAEFKVAPSPTAAAIKIRGDGPGNVDIPETTGTLAGDTITLAATEAANAFANEIDLMKPMTINWQVSLDGGTTWCDAGKSTNVLYVTWDSPEQATPIQTLVDVGCDAADGQTGTVGTDDDDVLDKVWTRLQTRTIHRASDAFVLTYYGFYDANSNGTWDARVDTDRNDPGSCTVTDAEGLISSANGQCHSWADFMNEVMKAQGLSSINGVASKRVAVVIKAGDVAFAVQNWAKTGNSPRKIIDADAGVDGTSPTAPNPANDEAADAAGADGQGNSPNPPSHFGNHWITKMNGKFFDPSYGLGPYTDQKAYEGDAFEGSIDQVGPDYFLQDLPADNSNPADHSDEINDYTELAFP